ncbi:MAG: lipid-A-disaccharide synthase [Bradymonadia bacterium]
MNTRTATPTAPWLAIAGEASGDALLGAALEATTVGPWWGVGGDAAEAAGVGLVRHASALAGQGLGEAISTVPAVISTLRMVKARLRGCRGALLVDFPELNMRVLKAAERVGVPVAWLSPPQAWAWRSWRSAGVARAQWVGCLMPFESDWYRSRGVPAHWVGHPLAERLMPELPSAPAVCLLPGSRDPAVARLLPLMLTAAIRLRRQWPELGFHLPVAPTVDRAPVVAAIRASGLPVRIWSSSAEALAASTVVLSTAGTSSLEATLAGRPVVVAGHLPAGAAWVARRLVRVPHVALPNLILGREAWPELVLDACTPEAMAERLGEMAAVPERWREPLSALRDRMTHPEGGTFAERIAEGLASLPPVRRP